MGSTLILSNGFLTISAGACSRWKCAVSVSVTRGVPQGFILGPVLFILYTADIVASVRNCRCHLSANDLQIYVSFDPLETRNAVVRLSEDITRIAQ